jgi:sugar lactone lactonase YvrE
MRSRWIFVVALIAGAALTATASLAATGSGFTIWTVAGTGSGCATPPSCGDGGAGTKAQLSFPEGVAVGPQGNAYIADWGDNEVRRVAADGTIATVAGTGVACSTPPSCGDGGAATRGRLSFPEGVAVGSDGSVYIADSGDNEVRKVSPTGKLTRFAGTGADCVLPPACGDGGAASAAQLSQPAGVAVDRAGDVYIADTGDSEVRMVSPAGKISRIAGTGAACATAPSCGDNGVATAALLNFPGGIVVDPAGNAYVADAGDNEVRKISPSGTITRIAGSGKLCSVPSACGDGGPAISADLSGPDGVAITPGGALFIADAGDNEIRQVSAAGKITLSAGDGSACSLPPSCGDGGVASSAQLDYPDGVAVDPGGSVYVADTYDHELRWLSRASVATLVGATGKVALSAFAADVARAAVTVRYGLSGTAALALSVSSGGGVATLVARAQGRPGFGELLWNRRLGGKPALRGRYTLTVTATAAGHSASSRLSVRLT